VTAALVATVGAPLLLEHSVMPADFPANLSKFSSSVPDELGPTNWEEVGGTGAATGTAVANVESPEALVKIVFDVPGAAALEAPGAAAFEVPGVAAFEVPGAAALEVPGAAAFEGMAAGFEVPAEIAFDDSAAAVFSWESLDRMPLSGWVAEAWNSVLSGGDVEGECWGVLKNTQSIKLFTMSPVFFFLGQQVVFIILCDLNKVVVDLTRKKQCCVSGSGIRCFFTPGSRIRDLVVRSGMNIPDHLSMSLETFFGLKILKFFDADPYPGFEIYMTLGPGWKNLDPKSGEISRIRNTGKMVPYR
jgi:hypothetical protein